VIERGDLTPFAAREVPRPSRGIPAEFEGLLLAAALHPLAQELGPFGDIVVDAIALDLARSARR
jgi:hypothetical protein